MILEAVREENVHPSADYIYDKLKKDNPNLSLGTVYRNLAKLTEKGFIHKVSFPGEPDRFDGQLSEHYHFKCEICGNIVDIKSDKLSEINDYISEEQGIKVLSSNISFKGICSDCKKEI